jgi:hypothetical protein
MFCGFRSVGVAQSFDSAKLVKVKLYACLTSRRWQTWCAQLGIGRRQNRCDGFLLSSRPYFLVCFAALRTGTPYGIHFCCLGTIAPMLDRFAFVFWFSTSKPSDIFLPFFYLWCWVLFHFLFASGSILTHRDMITCAWYNKITVSIVQAL